MPDFPPARARRFPALHASDAPVLVLPDGLETAEAAQRVREALARYGGRMPEAIPQRRADAALYQHAPVIACGNLTNNPILERLYTMRCCFVDTFFPGPDGYFVKSVSDPFGGGCNAVVVGAGGEAELLQALAVFEGIIHDREGDLTRVHAHRLAHELPPYPDASQMDEMIRAELALWTGGWSASPFRGGQLLRYLWHFYLTDHPAWGRVIPPIFAGSIDPWLAERREHPESYHCFFGLHNLIRLWDLVEDSPLYSDEDRQGVATMFGHLLRHLAGLFYLRPDVNPPDEPRQNHVTFIALSLAAGHDYLVRRYGIREFEPTVEAVERIFHGQADSYKPNDDAGVGYAWHVPLETFHYFLYKNDYRYLDGGPVADLCRLAAVTVDNMRSEASYGDTGGYAGFTPGTWNLHLWPLMASTWRTRNPAHLWLLNWLGAGKRPTLLDALSGLYAGVRFTPEGFALDGVVPERPSGLLGIHRMALPASALRWVHNHAPPPYRPAPDKAYFDKISMRPSFDPQDEYLLLEGVGTFCHGHEDANAIVRLTWRNRVWLADSDYIRAAPKFHNAVAVVRDGVGVLRPPGEGVVIPPLATVEYLDDGERLGLLMTETAGYNGVDWRRHIFWGKGRYLLVMDQLRATAAGDYHSRCLWRLIGEVERDGRRTRLHQQGEEFFLYNADGAHQEVIPDLYERGAWAPYPYADKRVQVLHQVKTGTLSPGEEIVHINLLTPCPDLRIERLSDRTVKVTDGDAIVVLGVGPATLGAVTVEGTMFALTLSGDTLTLRGVQRLGYPAADGEKRWETFDGAAHTLDLAAWPVARHLKTAMTVHRGRPARTAHPAPLEAAPVCNVAWTAHAGPACLAALDMDGASVLCGTEDGTVLCLSAADGAERWRVTHDRAITAVRLAALEGAPVAIAGTAASELIVFSGDTGRERWRAPLRNIWDGGEPVADIAVADLYGDGRRSVLAGTAGWYVNAFAADGAPLWATWVRYHAITRLVVEDADGDGQAEVMVGNIYSTPLTVHHADGSFRWSTLEQVGAEGNATTPRRGVCLTRMVLTDVNGDGVREIVYGTADGWIYAVSPRDGAECWRASIVGDVTGLALTPSGIAASSEFGMLYRFARDGRMRWHATAARSIHALAALGDNTVIATPDGALLRHDAGGLCTASCVLPHGITMLRACGPAIICAMDSGDIARISERRPLP
jgi:outer membrane protein assembly factor BamB